jgi:hypothetical protein
MDSFGIVDRDRRDDQEVEYLRSKRVMVPDVAEIENMFLIEDVVRAMATVGGHDAVRAVAKVKRTVIALFKADVRQQALQHTRHYMKRMMERRVDGRFPDIATLEKHVASLLDELAPRQYYERLCREFHGYADSGDYANVLRVFNQKSMLASSNVAALCGYSNKDRYINGVISLLRTRRPEADAVRAALRRTLGAPAQ